MSDPLILSVIPKGHPNHLRFILSNQLKQIWTGEDWCYDESKALLFSDENKLGEVCEQLLKESAHDKPVYRFTAPVEIEIRSGSVPCILDLQFWLMNAARLYVDYLQCGNGPTEDGVVLISIDWTKMLEEE